MKIGDCVDATTMPSVSLPFRFPPAITHVSATLGQDSIHFSTREQHKLPHNPKTMINQNGELASIAATRRRQVHTMKAGVRQLVAIENATYQGQGAQEFDLAALEGYHANPVWREKVTQWCYDVVDHLNESRSVVYVAMNILDRFTVKQDADTVMSDRTFELASLSALFLAVRISGSGNLRLSQLVGMSRSTFAAKDIIDMGTRMIKTLTWDSRVVTPLEFVKAMCAELPASVDASTKQSILDSASYLVEISVCDLSFSTKRASHTALAAMLNSLNENRSLGLAHFNQSVEAITEHVAESRQVMETRIHLRKVFNESCENRQVASPHLIEDDLPTCVSEESLSSLDSSSSEESIMPTAGGLKRVSREYFDQQPTFKRRKTELA